MSIFYFSDEDDEMFNSNAWSEDEEDPILSCDSGLEETVCNYPSPCSCDAPPCPKFPPCPTCGRQCYGTFRLIDSRYRVDDSVSYFCRFCPQEWDLSLLDEWDLSSLDECELSPPRSIKAMNNLNEGTTFQKSKEISQELKEMKIHDPQQVGEWNATKLMKLEVQ